MNTRKSRANEEHYSGEDVSEYYDGFCEYLRIVGFNFLDNGGFRKVFHRNNVVIKVPTVSDGIVDNMVEAAAWKKYKNSPMKNGVLLAPCRLLENRCLLMMYVEKCHTLPEWKRHIEGKQIGAYNGKFVAFDYALNIQERSKWEEEWGIYSFFFNGILKPEWKEVG